MYYVKAAEEMLSMWYFGTLYAVIYSLNLDLANKYVPLKNSTAPLAVLLESVNTANKCLLKFTNLNM